MTEQPPPDPPTLGERLAAKCEQIAQQVRAQRRQHLEVVRDDEWWKR